MMLKPYDIWDSIERHRIKGRDVDAPSVLLRKNGGWMVPGLSPLHVSFFPDNEHCGMASLSMLAAARYAQANLQGGRYTNSREVAISTPFPRYGGLVTLEGDQPVLWIEFNFGIIKDDQGAMRSLTFKERLGYPHKLKAAKFEQICTRFYRCWMWFQHEADQVSALALPLSEFESRSRPFFMHLGEVADRIPTLAAFYRLIGYEVMSDSFSKPFVKHIAAHDDS
jgi:hypothetical protein